MFRDQLLHTLRGPGVSLLRHRLWLTCATLFATLAAGLPLLRRLPFRLQLRTESSRDSEAAGDGRNAPAPTTGDVVHEVTVPADMDGCLLVDALLKLLPREFPSNSVVKRAASRNLLRVSGRNGTLDTPVREGDCLQCLRGVPKRHLANPQQCSALRVPVVYEDAWLAVVLKPPGVSVQGDPSAKELRKAVGLQLPPPSDRSDALGRPQHVHRLDKQTGGLLVYARCHAANVLLSMAFAEHSMEDDGEGVVAASADRVAKVEPEDQTAQSDVTEQCAATGASVQSKPIQKRYLALIVGLLRGTGTIDEPISGKQATSHWRALQSTRSGVSGWITTVELQPQTGRRHQLRRHMAFLGCPILGDPRYGSNVSRAAEFDGQYMLYASALELCHPASGALLALKAPEPEYFAEVLRREDAAADAKPELWRERALQAEAAWAERSAHLPSGSEL